MGMSTIMTIGAQVTAMAVSRRGNCLLVGGGDGAVSIFLNAIKCVKNLDTKSMFVGEVR